MLQWHKQMEKICHSHGSEKMIWLKWSYYQRHTTDSMQSLSKFQWHFSALEQIILKFVWKHKRFQITKTILRKKLKAENSTPPDFKLYYKTTEIKMVWYWHKNRHRSLEQNRMNPYLYGELIYGKGGKNRQRGKTVSSINGVEKTG